MREIEFRGLAMSGGWVYGNYIHSKRFKGCSNEYRIHNVETGLESDVYPETVGQYTGLKDKEGVKIYEGDIVIIGTTSSVIKYFPKYGMFGLTGKSAYRKFDESEPMGSGGSSTRYKPYVLSEYYQRRMEVIGNIHEHPELLK